LTYESRKYVDEMVHQMRELKNVSTAKDTAIVEALVNSVISKLLTKTKYLLLAESYWLTQAS
jgi:hypothetical protein